MALLRKAENNVVSKRDMLFVAFKRLKHPNRLKCFT